MHLWQLQLCVKFCGHGPVGHSKILIERNLAAATVHFEKEQPVRMAFGVNACLTGFGCCSFPHTRAPALTLPRQAKARHGMAWHGMGW